MSAQFKKHCMQKKLVFGLGQTGLSCVRFLVEQGYEVAVFDSRENPPLIEQLYCEFPNVEVTLQFVTDNLFDDVDQVILSPGISLKSENLSEANARNINIVGDIELFAQFANAPIIAITGSNGKTTTTTLVAEIFEAAGLNIEVGGNIGIPVLELLNKPKPDYYILELSSFQLETTHTLNPLVAVVLNISEDHMDRYDDLNQYADAKLSIMKGASNKIFNRDDKWLNAQLSTIAETAKEYVGFSEASPSMQLNNNSKSDYGLSEIEGEVWIVSGARAIFRAKDLKLQGRHQLMNAVAAVAVAEICHIDKDVMTHVLKAFDGLEHRTQYIATINGVSYINDSKGTNVGATVAAIAGFETPIILLAGGDGKGADFSPLASEIKNKVHCVILFGRDAGIIEKAINKAEGTCVTRVIRAVSLEAAVNLAYELATDGETVLLSPACASFDMFNSYQHRGDVFVAAVKKISHANNVEGGS